MEKMNLKWLKEEMWIEVCEGEVIEMNNEYKELVNELLKIYIPGYVSGEGVF